MLRNIIYFSIHNKLLILIGTLALVVWGTWSALRLPIDAVPDITNNQVQIMTVSPSLATQEVERLITFPVEVNMANIPGIEEIRSFSRFGLSIVTVVFDDETDQYWARQQVSERLQLANEQIPPGIGIPTLAPVTTGLGEIYQYTLQTKPGYVQKYTPMQLRTIQDWVVRRQLLGTKGVADVSSLGGFLKQYEIAVDPYKLRSMDVSIQEIFTALAVNNQNTGGAYIEKEPNTYFIRTEGLINSMDDIGKIVVKNTGNGTPLLIRDVAVVQFGHAVKYGAVTHNGQGEVVGGIVLMLKGANSNEVIQAVKHRISEINQMLPEGLEIAAYLDRSHLVKRAIHTVSTNLIEGALIVIFVLVIFLGNLRAGLIVASVIPLSMLFAIALMKVFGISGNLMSLGAIDFGLIVDGAVIIVESTLHHLSAKGLTHQLTQEQMDHEVFESSSNIRSSAAFGEIIILIVYLPLMALVGVEGKMFKPMAQTVAFAIIGAFILSVTYVPMMSSWLLDKRQQEEKNFSHLMMGFFTHLYSPALHWVMRRASMVMAGSVLLFIISLFIFSTLGGEFIPTLDEGDFAVETRVLKGSSINVTIDAALRAGQLLKDHYPDEVEKVIGKIGAGEIPTDPMPMEAADLMVILKDRQEWTQAGSWQELAGKMQHTLEAVTGVTFGFQQPIQMRFNELMTGARQDVSIKIYGDDLNLLATQANRLATIVRPIAGVEDLYVEEVTGLSQLVVRFDRDKVAQFGLNIQDLNRAVSTAFAGEKAGVIYEGERRFDLVVRLAASSRQNTDDIKNMSVTSNSGLEVPIGSLASVAFETGPNQIHRDDTKRRISVAFNVRGRDVESIVREIQVKAAQMQLPAGYYLSYGGQFKNLLDAKDRLSIVVPLALGLIFLLLFLTFRSVSQSLLIFTAIPLSAIGGVVALWLRQMPFSISAGVGFIALFGVSVLNGIVLIAEFNRLAMSGNLSLQQIVINGTHTRLRPVLMTALVASLGFLPMAFSSGSGAEVQKPLATVVIGGLVSSTLLTLLVLPVLYIMAEKRPKSYSPPLQYALVVFLFASSLPAQAQNNKLQREQIIAIAIQQHHGIEAATMAVEAQEHLKTAGTDLGKTNISFTYGQYNSYFRDNQLAINQTIPFPGIFAKNRQLLGANYQAAAVSKKVIENDVRFQVKSAYNTLLYHTSRYKILSQQDSLYQFFIKAAKLKVKTGESNMLEQATAESQLLEYRILQDQAATDMQAASLHLAALINTESLQLADTSLRQLPVPTVDDTTALSQHPMLQLLAQQGLVSEASQDLEKQKLFPEFTIGYFNQTLFGTTDYRDANVVADRRQRFQGVTVGLGFPIWAKPYLGRIKSLKASRYALTASQQLYRKNLMTEFQTTLAGFRQHSKALQYYQTSLLANAAMIGTSALKNFQAGNIGYLEFSQALTRALTIQMNYLHALSQYNQSIIKWEHLTGN